MLLVFSFRKKWSCSTSLGSSQVGRILKCSLKLCLSIFITYIQCRITPITPICLGQECTWSQTNSTNERQIIDLIYYFYYCNSYCLAFPTVITSFVFSELAYLWRRPWVRWISSSLYFLKVWFKFVHIVLDILVRHTDKALISASINNQSIKKWNHLLSIVMALKKWQHLKVSWAGAAEGAVFTAELLSRVLPQVNIQVGFKEKNFC